MLFFSFSMQIWNVLCLFSILCAASDSEALDDDSNDFNNAFFVSEIFDKYGDNNSITFEGFEHLLENLGLGKLKFETNHDVSIHKINGSFKEFHDELSLHKHSHGNLKARNESYLERKRRNLMADENEMRSNVAKVIKRKCLTPQDILVTFGIRPYHDAIISPANYLQICPAIIYELDQKLCQTDGTDFAELAEELKEYHLVWLYASVSILVMGVSGMLCVLLVPIVKNNSDTILIQFLVSLAAGTLCGDALIHLLPQVYITPRHQLNQSRHSDLTSIFKGFVSMIAIFLFFIIESALKKNKKKPSQRQNELDNMIEVDEIEQKDHFAHNHGSDEIKSVAWMAIIGDVLHNVTDGLSIGAAFTSRLSAGFASSIAIFCHELPHELGDYAILLASGMSVKKSLFYNFLSSVFSLIGMIAGILLGEFEHASLWINSFTAGSFLYIALTDLLPEMKLMTSRSNFKNFITQVFGVSCGGILMFSIALYEDEIEHVLC